MYKVIYRVLPDPCPFDYVIYTDHDLEDIQNVLDNNIKHSLGVERLVYIVSIDVVHGSILKKEVENENINV